MVLRNHVLKNFEKAAWTADAAQREALTTIVVVGGGPTGLETAGAFQELLGKVLRKEYAIQLGDVPGRVILVERLDHLLSPYPERLRRAARLQLERWARCRARGRRSARSRRTPVVRAADRATRPEPRTCRGRHGVAAGAYGSQCRSLAPARASHHDATGDRLRRCLREGDLAYLEDERGEPNPDGHS